MAKQPKKKRFSFEEIPEVLVTFRNLLDPGKDITFNHQGRQFGPLEDGRNYTLPMNTIHHLRRLGVKQTAEREDPKTGNMFHEVVGFQYRFAVTEVDTATNDYRGGAPKKKARAKASQKAVAPPEQPEPDPFQDQAGV